MNPDKIIPLLSNEGQQLLKECTQQCYPIQQLLINVFIRQDGMATCGIQSAGLLLNAAWCGHKDVTLSSPFGKAQSINPTMLPYTESRMLQYAATKTVVTSDYVRRHGTTLEQVAAVIRAHGHEARIFHADSVNIGTMREHFFQALSSERSVTGISINYRIKRGRSESYYGHHSPIAAYHTQTGQILISDTKGEEFAGWATLSDVYAAMDTLDRSTGKKRGYIIFTVNSDALLTM